MRLLNPGDIAYVTLGYASLSVRLVEQAMRPEGWKPIQDALKQLPGPSAELSQIKVTKDDVLSNNNTTSSTAYGGDRKVMLVYFLGGVTYMEIAALRYLAKQQDCQYDIIIHRYNQAYEWKYTTSFPYKEMLEKLNDKL